MTRKIIHTDNAPKAIGTYSQAVKIGDTVYLSGQIPLVPATMELVSGDVKAQIRRVFDNLKAVAEAAGGSLAASAGTALPPVVTASARSSADKTMSAPSLIRRMISYGHFL